MSFDTTGIIKPQNTAAHCRPAHYSTQDVIVGGAVIASVSAALYGGLRKDPVTCDLCLGTGGTKCFGCNGEGKMLIPKDLVRPNASTGRSSGPRRCKVCKGVGMVLCSKCKGSGYIQPSQLEKREVQTGQKQEE
ncbi:hypothetical protein DUNSADRAFT_4215 [Dunaliella salina]|uniref:Uncharacterized protein n=1 Tax=Dunaliella salina TaxID=3046 RepID=A0ABQ7GSD4_DUNSA|nr:hypothetical protein DUNSADRAFT_4215 [Dunaliella salina]|eukprot:KAF5837522.1 hypothetical protein DUNSADRAFT_4215 [Dunaliella salina]